MSCCPPNAETFLQATYATKGACTALPSGVEAYVTGSAALKKAILVLPDVFGWNSGHTRNIADMLADTGYLVVIPKLLSPGLEGGTDGDGLFPAFDFATDTPLFPPFCAQYPYQGCLDAKVGGCVSYLHGEGCDKISVLAFCWGGWVAVHALKYSTGPFLCAAIAHPSVSLEGMVFGGDIAALMATVDKPVMLLPAKGDPEQYHSGGAWFEEIKTRHPSSKSVFYPNENHGFLSRGDVGNAASKDAIDDALGHVIAFFAEHM